MDKKTFVQSAVIRAMNDKPDLTIAWAEQAWQALTHAGYGAAKPGAPRSKESHYDRLGERRSAFDEAWKRYNYKAGRDQAAKAFLEIVDYDEATEKHIMHSCEIEGKKQRQYDEKRKHFSTWINQRCWTDHEMKKITPTDLKAIQRRDLEIELRNAETTARMHPEGSNNQRIWLEQAEKIKAELARL